MKFFRRNSEHNKRNNELVARSRAMKMMTEAETCVTNEGVELKRYTDTDRVVPIPTSEERKTIIMNISKRFPFGAKKPMAVNISSTSGQRSRSSTISSQTSISSNSSKITHSQRRSAELAFFNDMYGDGGLGRELCKEASPYLEQPYGMKKIKSKTKTSFGSFLSKSKNEFRKIEKSSVKEKREKTVYKEIADSRDQISLFEIDHVMTREERSGLAVRNRMKSSSTKITNDQKQVAEVLRKTKSDFVQSMNFSEDHIGKGLTKSVYAIHRNRTSSFLHGRRSLAAMNQVAYSQAQELMSVMEMTTEGLELNPKGLQVAEIATSYGMNKNRNPITRNGVNEKQVKQSWKSVEIREQCEREIPLSHKKKYFFQKRYNEELRQNLC